MRCMERDIRRIMGMGNVTITEIYIENLGLSGGPAQQCAQYKTGQMFKSRKDQAVSSSPQG